jgi:hypothetical protein
MGNANKSVGYAASDFDEEVEIRQFEEESGAFKKNLSSILSKICLEGELIPIESATNYVLKDFSEQFQRLLHHEYFYKVHEGRKYFHAGKLKLLLFLLTKDMVVDNKMTKYHDKANFIVEHCKACEDEEISYPIQKEDHDFEDFISHIFDIACVGLVDAYIKFKNVQRDGYLVKLRDFKEQTCERIVNTLFAPMKNEKVKATKSEGITFQELNKRFDNNPYLFSSGWVREMAWISVKEEAGQIEQKERDTAELRNKEN